MSGKVLVRPVSRGDGHIIASMMAEVLPDLSSGRSDESEFIVDAVKSAPTTSKRNRSSLLIATVGSSPAGFLMMHNIHPFNRDFLHSAIACLSHMGVLPDFRLHGVGHRLLSATEDAARDLGYELIWASVENSTRRFYETAGWTVGEPGEGIAWCDRARVSWSDPIPDALRGQDHKFSKIQSKSPVPGQKYDCVAWKLVTSEPMIEPWAYQPRDNDVADAYEALGQLSNRLIEDPSLISLVHESTLKSLRFEGARLNHAAGLLGRDRPAHQ